MLGRTIQKCSLWGLSFGGLLFILGKVRARCPRVWETDLQESRRGGASVTVRQVATVISRCPKSQESNQNPLQSWVKEKRLGWKLIFWSSTMLRACETFSNLLSLQATSSVWLHLRFKWEDWSLRMVHGLSMFHQEKGGPDPGLLSPSPWLLERIAQFHGRYL